ncbi:hypothetical protein [Larsenimonas suaedae]|uniref:Transposase n=1 Tax=Larsenimonas suaedae TaxID=1851019 RepID=A0ABU1GXR3_9GAMM|nr:hypothetical protein [Larsenimonas suaedae]MCM2973452.1 hypothetical protein [Larsenimonas suaedae]MDR5896346.1 hypothetical protein [Larsenimonas suaedae]
MARAQDEQYTRFRDWQTCVPVRWAPPRYELIQWRKRKERAGWKDGKRFVVLRRRPIEYCAVHDGRIWKGATLLERYRVEDGFTKGSPAWLLIRQYNVDAVVWRLAHPISF